MQKEIYRQSQVYIGYSTNNVLNDDYHCQCVSNFNSYNYSEIENIYDAIGVRRLIVNIYIDI